MTKCCFYFQHKLPYKENLILPVLHNIVSVNYNVKQCEMETDEKIPEISWVQNVAFTSALDCSLFPYLKRGNRR